MTFCKSSRLFPVTRILSSWICDLTLIPEFLIAVLIFAFSLSIPLIKSPYWRAVPPKAFHFLKMNIFNRNIAFD